MPAFQCVGWIVLFIPLPPRQSMPGQQQGHKAGAATQPVNQQTHPPRLLPTSVTRSPGPTTSLTKSTGHMGSTIWMTASQHMDAADSKAVGRGLVDSNDAPRCVPTPWAWFLCQDATRHRHSHRTLAPLLIPSLHSDSTVHCCQATHPQSVPSKAHSSQVPPTPAPTSHHPHPPHPTPHPPAICSFHSP